MACSAMSSVSSQADSPRTLATCLTAAAVVSFEMKLPFESGKSGQSGGTRPNSLVANPLLWLTADETVWNGQMMQGFELPGWQQHP